MYFKYLPSNYPDVSNTHRMIFTRKLSAIFCCILLTCLLAACGSSPTTGQQAQASLSPTPTIAPTPTPQLTPTPRPTPRPTPTSTPKPPPQPPAPTRAPLAPTQVPPAPILDVAPSSMSIIGHLDCHKTATVFICQAAVISGASNQATLYWTAFANIMGVSFSPAQGNLAPGTRMILTIDIPVHECAGTFFFQGPINTHTISWQC